MVPVSIPKKRDYEAKLVQIHEIVLQLRGEAGPRQVNKAKMGLSHVYGGGGYSCVTILKR
jgi:acetyl-CoA acyltransferase